MCKPCFAAYLRERRRRARQGLPPKPIKETPTSKVCQACKQDLPLEAFYRHTGTSDGRTMLCIPCHKIRRKARYAANREQALENARRWVRENPEKATETRRRAYLKKKYGISLEDYEQRLVEQGGRCAICGTTEPGNTAGEPIFRIDHCHDSGKVRGLLCNACNAGMGQLGDNVDRLLAAAAYLLQHQDVLAQLDR